MKKLIKTINEARKAKSELKLNIRLKHNGRFSSIKGHVKDMKISIEGETYVVIRGGKHDYQTVPLDNVLAVVRDGEVVKR